MLPVSAAAVLGGTAGSPEDAASVAAKLRNDVRVKL